MRRRVRFAKIRCLQLQFPLRCLNLLQTLSSYRCFSHDDPLRFLSSGEET